MTYGNKLEWKVKNKEWSALVSGDLAFLTARARNIQCATWVAH